MAVGRFISLWKPVANSKDLWPSKAVRAKRLLALDGIRLVAIVWLISSEAFTSVFWPPQSDRIEFLGTAQYVLNADLAYDLFLLVSGVSITSMVLAEVDTTGGFNILQFTFRRWLSLWPALACGLLLNMLLDRNAASHCSDSLEWLSVLLFVNNYVGDLRCMPQTWLVAVLFQLYLLTPFLIFACVNYQTREMRRYMSGFIILIFLSTLPIFVAWLFYETWGNEYVYSPMAWPPGPFFKGVFLRWSPYIAGMAVALLKWDASIPLEDGQEKKNKEQQGMPLHEMIAERMPVTCQDATGVLLDLLADILCLLVMLWITFEGTQQSKAHLSLLLRVTYAWVAARLLYRLLSHRFPALENMLSTGVSYTAAKLAYCGLVLQGLIFFDIRGLLSVFESPATEPLAQSIGLYILAWLMLSVAFAVLGYVMHLLVRHPFQKLVTVCEDGQSEGGKQSQPDIPPPLQRKKSIVELQGKGKNLHDESSLSALGVTAVHDMEITVKSDTSSVLQTFPNEFVPSKGGKYFQGKQPIVERDGAYWILCTVSAYNEGGEDMAETLISLHEQAQNLPEGVRMHILLVFDGWNKTSASMRRYMARLYPGSEAEQQKAVHKAKSSPQESHSPRWIQEVDRTDSMPWYKKTLPVTFTLQQLSGNGQLSEVDIAPGRSLFVSTIIKFDNRKKSNSHEWYLRAFGKQYESKLMYLTDVGTTADQYCVPRLAHFMDINPDYVAVTGFQRVQRLRQGATLVEHLQREVQAYELGPGMCHNVKASQGLLGFQLILCGPCQMIRSEDALKDDFLDAFFNMINKDPTEAGILHANIQLTEDMAFGCYLYGMTPNKKTGYVPDAYFDYDVETAPDRFMKQRRRWNNGIVAGIHHLINPFGRLWCLSQKPWHLRLTNFVVMCQQYLLVMQFLILPGIYIFNIFQALGGFHMQQAATTSMGQTHPLFPIYFDYIKPIEWLLPMLGSGLYVVFLSVWVFSHRRREFIPWMYYVMLVVNLVIGTLTAAFIISFFADTGTVYGPTASSLVMFLYLTPLLSPVLSSLALGDTYGIVVSIVNLPFMLAFLPMWILLGGYGIARFCDLTWGNRPHESDSLDGSRRDEYMKKCQAMGLRIILMYLLGNVAIGGFLIALGFMWSGNSLLIFLVLVIPFFLSSCGGLIFNIQYAAKYRWGGSLRRCLAFLSGKPKSSSPSPAC